MSVLFLIPQIQDGCHNILLSDLLKNPKICDNYLVVETKKIFLAEPMESRIYLDDHILLY